jgi:hypothetical protein
MDIQQLVAQYYCTSRRKTAKAIAAAVPDINADGLRKQRDFIAAHDALTKSLIAGLGQVSADEEDDEPETIAAPTSTPDALPPSVPGLSYERSIDKVLDEKITRVKKAFDNYKLHRVKRWELKQSLPLAIVHLGDPHLDNPHCRIDLLREHLTLIQQARSTGLNVVAGNIGDSLDNWVGKLQELYSESYTTYLEGIQLLEWLLKSVPWLYVICGNHDKWNRGDLLIKMLGNSSDIHLITTPGAETKVEIIFGNGKTFRLLARHDFKRRSMYHVTHGGLAAGREDPWCDLSVAGHLHSWGETNYEDRLGKVRSTIRVRGYKIMDSYALENGYHDDEHGHAIVTVVDPLAPDSQRFVNYRDVGYGLQQLRLLHEIRSRE